MDKRPLIALFAISILLFGCSHREQTTTNSSNSESATTTESPTEAPVPATSSVGSEAPVPSGTTAVSFNFNDVAVTTSGAPVLRLGFDLKNDTKDPLLCDPTEFSVQLADGSIVPVDTGAEDTCDPDTVDPGSTGKVVMFFDLKSAYSGPVTLLMTSNGAMVGKGTTQVH